MATISINGIACQFPKVPLGTLESWPVSSRTHYLAYKIHHNYLLNSTITALLSAAYEIGALARPPFWVADEEGRAIVLLENPSATVMDTITSWITWINGPNCHVYTYPYQNAIVELRQRAEEQANETNRTLDLMKYDNLYKRTLGAGNPLKTHD